MSGAHTTGMLQTVQQWDASALAAAPSWQSGLQPRAGERTATWRNGSAMTRTNLVRGWLRLLRAVATHRHRRIEELPRLPEDNAAALTELRKRDPHWLTLGDANHGFYAAVNKTPVPYSCAGSLWDATASGPDQLLQQEERLHGKQQPAEDGRS